MPINLDFVGLNTLVREESNPTTNTIGEAKVKAIRIADEDPSFHYPDGVYTIIKSGFVFHINS